MIGKAVLFGVLAVVVYAYMTSEPLPPDLAIEFGYTKIKAIMKTSITISKIAYFLGIDPVQLNRRIYNWVQPTLIFSDKDIKIFDEVFDGVPVRLYMPMTNGKSLNPGIVYLHGGGWMFGSINFAHTFVRQLALDTGAVIASVEYRLAPEHVFPAAYDDSLKATVHFMKNSKQYGVDERRIGVSGQSAGGNLAAAVSLGICDNHPEMKLKLQILNNPITQCADFNTPSYQQNDKLTNAVLSKRAMIICCMLYAVGIYDEGLEANVTDNLDKSIASNNNYNDILDHNWIPKYLIPTWYKPISVSEDKVASGLESKFTDQIINPYLSPLLAPNLKSLPEAYIMVAEFDVLRDDALLYIRRLREANVTVTEAYDKTIHGAAVFGSPAQGALHMDGVSKTAYYRMVEFIKNRL